MNERQSNKQAKKTLEKSQNYSRIPLTNDDNYIIMANMTNNNNTATKENNTMDNLTIEQRTILSQVFDAMRDDREGNGSAKLATAKRLKGELAKALAKNNSEK